MKPGFQLELLRALCGAPLLLHPDYMVGLTSLLLRSAASRSDRDLAAVPAGAEKGMKPWEAYEAVTVTSGGTAVIPMRGMLYAGVDQMTAWYWGLCRPEALQSAAEDCLSDPKIKAVVLASDTPGGVVTKIDETAESMAELSAQKLTVTHVDGMCCSAGYWIASQTKLIDAPRSSLVGSVGTYAAYYDITRMLQQEGIDLNLFKAGKFKAMGIPGKPLNDDEKALIQSRIDTINSGFVGSVQAARPQIARADLEGQTFPGSDAVKRGLADSSTRNLAAVLRQLDAR